MKGLILIIRLKWQEYQTGIGGKQVKHLTGWYLTSTCFKEIVIEEINDGRDIEKWSKANLISPIILW